MKEIVKLEKEIRELINKPRRQNILLKNNINWNLLCASLDSIEDTNYAIDSYLKHKNNHFEEGFSYVLIYGILQALFLQQDAIKNIALALDIKYEIDIELKNIRQIRNCSIGHPVRKMNKKYQSFNHIQRFGINHTNFRLLSYFPLKSDPVFLDINIPKIINKQNKIVIKILKDFIFTLKEEEKKHKKKYKDIKMMDFFKNINYIFSKLYEGVFNDSYKPISKLIFNELEGIIINFKEELQNRELLGNVIGIDETLKEISYPLNKLKLYFEKNKITNKEDLNIYIFYLQKKIEELIEMSKEIDDDYTK